MEQPAIRVRRATPGDVDSIVAVLAGRADGQATPSPERIQYVYSALVTELNVEIYVAEAEGRVAGFLIAYYLEHLSRGGLSAVVPEVVAPDKGLETQTLRALIERARRAAASRHCRRIELYAPFEEETLVATARQMGFEVTAQGLSAPLE